MGATPHWSSPAPSPVAPQGTQPHITRASPHLPATSPHSQPRHLACPPLPRTLRRAGGGGRCPPQSQKDAAGSPPPRPVRLEVDRGLGGGGRLCGALGLRGESPRGQCQPAPSPASFPTAHSVPGARALRGSPHSCPSPQIRADSPSLRCSGPHSSPADHLRLGGPGDAVKWLGGWTPGLSLTCSPRLALWWEIKCPSPAHLPPPVLFGAW